MNGASQQKFRQWTRGLSFTLAMGKTQVANLVAIAESRRLGYSVGLYHRLGGRFVQGVGGLADRGLILERPDAAKNKTLGRFKWTITSAGALVIALLKVSGVYQELAAEMLESDKERGMTRAVDKEIRRMLRDTSH